MPLALSPEAPPTDEALAESARQGEQGAFATLLLRHQARIYRLAIRISRNRSDAEEITQETFLRALRGMASFRGESQIGTWLFRIAVTECLMRRRAARRRPAISLELVLSPSGELGAVASLGGSVPRGADDLLHGKRITVQVRNALNELEQDQRDALVLRDLEELSAQEAGEILGVSAATVRQRAHRAKLKLRESLGHLVARA